MKKLSFEKFKSSKIDSSKIMGGKETATTYDRTGGGTGHDTVYEDEVDGSTCADFHEDSMVHCF